MLRGEEGERQHGGDEEGVVQRAAVVGHSDEPAPALALADQLFVLCDAVVGHRDEPAPGLALADELQRGVRTGKAPLPLTCRQETGATGKQAEHIAPTFSAVSLFSNVIELRP